MQPIRSIVLGLLAVPAFAAAILVWCASICWVAARETAHRGGK